MVERIIPAGMFVVVSWVMKITTEFEFRDNHALLVTVPANSIPIIEITYRSR